MRQASTLVSRFSRGLFQWITATALLTMASGAFAQHPAKLGAHAPKAKSKTVTDISLGIFGQLTPTRSPIETSSNQQGTAVNQTTQGTSASAGVLGTFHQSFTPWFGYVVNFGYSRFDENYSTGFGFTANQGNPPAPQYQSRSSFSGGSIGENTYELTAAYLVQGPRTKRIDTFFQLGGGVLSFLPPQDPSPYWVLFRPALVFGTGMNYRLSEHWALRAEYRGLFYRNPYYNGAATNLPMPEFDVVTSEPTISIVYRFGRKR